MRGTLRDARSKAITGTQQIGFTKRVEPIKMAVAGCPKSRDERREAYAKQTVPDCR
jgi:hypothetical protein